MSVTTLRRVTGDGAKRTLHDYLRKAREAMVWKLDGLSEYDVRRARTRAEIVDRYRRVWLHADATIDDLPADAPGHVPWWPRPDVTLHTMLVHVLAETNRHAGHADILREQLDGAAGMQSGNSNIPEHTAPWWADLRDRIEEAARTARS